MVITAKCAKITGMSDETRILCKMCDTDATHQHLDLSRVTWGTHTITVAPVYLCSKHSEMAAYGHIDNVSWVRKELK